MSRNTFEADDDPAEEIPLEEQVQRQFSIEEVDEAISGMSDREKKIVVGAQFKDVDQIESNIATMKQQGLWATARFFERLLEGRPPEAG